jgi:DNA mismatch endonuclease (patch repair protein)
LQSDIVDAATRSRMMAGIRGTHTKPERVIRKGLHRLGFRFRLHARDLPGRPDIVLPKWRAVILTNGCFWHGHSCELFRWPRSRADFWREKIEGNRRRDQANLEALHALGWRTLVIWECAIRGRAAPGPDVAVREASSWLSSSSQHGEIRGEKNGAS